MSSQPSPPPLPPPSPPPSPSPPPWDCATALGTDSSITPAASDKLCAYLNDLNTTDVNLAAQLEAYGYLNSTAALTEVYEYLNSTDASLNSTFTHAYEYLNTTDAGLASRLDGAYTYLNSTDASLNSALTDAYTYLNSTDANLNSALTDAYEYLNRTDVSLTATDKMLNSTHLAAVAENAMKIDTITGSNNAQFLLSSAYLVFFMQAGFAMLCAGSVRSKNTKNILIKNVLDACVGAIAFFIFGYGFAYGTREGKSTNEFIGTWNFGLQDFTDWAGFLFQWAFSAAAATIVSGSVAERTAFQAYLGYSFFLTAFVYPVVVHWVWDANGWLTAFKSDPEDLLFDCGMYDFAGSGVVHMTGGVAGLMGAMIVGPRTGRFGPDGRVVAMPGHNASLVVLGTFILWVGWYGFNPGSQLAIIGSETVVARTAVTTTLSAAAGGVTAMAINYGLYHVWDLIAVCNGVLAGLVGITAGCSVTEPWTAIVCGFLSAWVIHGAGKLLLKLKIDDPLEAAPMHGACGAFGVFWVGLMAKKEYVAEVYGGAEKCAGVFYGGDGGMLGAQVVGIICITLWVGGLLGLFFLALKKMNMLRTSPEEEQLGLDESKHGGSAYNMELVAPMPSM